MPKGYISLILHSHLPFVRHPDIDEALEERWLFEAMTESYIPLLDVIERLISEGVSFKITFSITPTLMTMLQDNYLNTQYEKYLKKAIRLAETETIRTKEDPSLNKLADFYAERLKNVLSIYNRYNHNILDAFKKFQDLGYIEIIASAATHGLLPLLMVNKEAVRAQIAIGVKEYTDFFGTPPRGIWLPECAFCFELEKILKENNIEYFISETIALKEARPKPKHVTYSPVITNDGIYVFGRDSESSHQVWSSTLGYPGNENYREFYRDIGHSLPMDYIAPYINPQGIRVDTGIKYYRVTGETEDKEIYNIEKAMDVAKKHGLHFLNSRKAQISVASSRMDIPPIVTCPYDTELFGHWWFEGPEFLYNFIKESQNVRETYELISPSDYIDKGFKIENCEPNPSSWGEKGDFSVWLNSSNDYIYIKIHSCEEYMTKLSNDYKYSSKLKERALKQAARELLLSEASDWPFIIKTDTSVEYAKGQILTHIERFTRLYDSIAQDEIDEKYLKNLENIDNIFPNIDISLYKSIKD